MKTKINWLALAGGVSTVILIAVSLFVPWWVLSVGQGLVKANVSPIYTDFSLIGNAFTVPLLFALNLASILTLSAGGIAMLIYSIKPEKPYSKKLLGFGYSKPLFSVVLFVIVLFALQQIVRLMVNLNVPIIGSATSTLPQSTTYGTVVTVLISAELQWPFYLAVAVATLCLAARFYHKKIAAPIKAIPTSTQTTAPTVAIAYKE
jgi:hypothetical protein